MGRAPRLVSFPDGAHCEVRDHEGIAALLAAGGHVDGWVVRLQKEWRWALVAVMIAVGSIAAAYRWGLPAVAEFIAFRLPDSAMTAMSSGTLDFLDRFFKPSALPPERQRAIETAFARLHHPAGKSPPFRLHFRSSEAIGPNAFALPDGTIVMTDQLVELAEHDEEILAVLAHELGHVDRRHGLRMLIQGSIVAFVVSWYIGDVSSVAAGLPTLLLQARYSRDHEREADSYCAALLKANGISPRRLAGILGKLEDARDKKKTAQDQKAAEDRGKTPGSTAAARVGSYLSSHPLTRERIETLER